MNSDERRETKPKTKVTATRAGDNKLGRKEREITKINNFGILHKSRRTIDKN